MTTPPPLEIVFEVKKPPPPHQCSKLPRPEEFGHRTLARCPDCGRFWFVQVAVSHDFRWWSQVRWYHFRLKKIIRSST